MAVWESIGAALVGGVFTLLVVLLTSMRQRSDNALAQLVQYRHQVILNAHVAVTRHLFAVTKPLKLVKGVESDGNPVRMTLSDISDALDHEQDLLTNAVALAAPYMEGRHAYTLNGYVEFSRNLRAQVSRDMMVEWSKGVHLPTTEFLNRSLATMQELQKAVPYLRDWMVSELNPGALRQITNGMLAPSVGSRIAGWLRMAWGWVKREYGALLPIGPSNNPLSK